MVFHNNDSKLLIMVIINAFYFPIDASGRTPRKNEVMSNKKRLLNDMEIIRRNGDEYQIIYYENLTKEKKPNKKKKESDTVQFMRLLF